MSSLARAVGEAAGRGRTGVAGEDRRVDGLHAAEGEHRDHGLEQQRQEDPDAVALADAELRQHAGGSIDLLLQLRVGQAPDLAVLALPGDRHGRWMGRGAPIHGRRGVVERAAAPPARPLDAAAEVQDLRGGALPVEVQVFGRGPRTRPGPARRVAGARSGRARRCASGTWRAGCPAGPPTRAATRRRPRRGRRSANLRLVGTAMLRGGRSAVRTAARRPDGRTARAAGVTGRASVTADVMRAFSCDDQSAPSTR